MYVYRVTQVDQSTSHEPIIVLLHTGRMGGTGCSRSISRLPVVAHGKRGPGYPVIPRV